jgi:hypothetical protein
MWRRRRRRRRRRRETRRNTLDVYRALRVQSPCD